METENQKLKDLEVEVKWWEKSWSKFIFITVYITLVALFISNILTNKPVVLDEWNQWISFILGLVATLISIISVNLSFYSIEKTNQINQENLKTINGIKNSIEDKINKIPEKTLDELKKYDKRLTNTPYNKQEINAENKTFS